MGIQEGAENARATREAREAVVHGAHPRDPMAVDAALRRYLAAEQYAREHHPDDRANDDTKATGEDSRPREPEMNTPKNAIVVAVGADGVDSALAFALDEARRTEHTVHLVHVLQLPTGTHAGVYTGALDTARATLAEATAQATELAAGEVPVTGELVDTGRVVGDLARRTGNVSLIVLQHRTLGRVHRMFAGSVAQSVAGRAQVPVVSVPAGWTHDSTHPPVVTAGVQDPVEAPALLRVAFEQARARKAALVVLHAWWLASGDSELVLDPAFSDEWSGRSRHEIEPVLEALRREFPFVDVSVSVRHAPPVAAMLDATESSDLVVLGRRHHLLPLGSHLGPVARGVLAHSACPVMITPELRVAAATGPDVEQWPAGLQVEKMGRSPLPS